MSQHFFWSGKTVVITGASSGLGLALVNALAPHGVRFCLLARRVEKMNALAEAWANSKSSFFIRACDIRLREGVESCINEFVAKEGPLDIAWVNSGVGYESSLRHFRWDEFESMIDTNIKGAVYTTQACLKHMVPARRGHIAAIASAAAMRGLPTNGIYSLTKIALSYYIEALEIEIPDVSFTCIYPGYVDTPINQKEPFRPFLMSPEKAASLMIRAIEEKKSVFIYPFRMKLIFFVVRSLPRWIYRVLLRKLILPSRQSRETRSR